MFSKHPKKYLGQNFLIDKNILNKIYNKILKNIELESIKTIIEIGPGKGALTNYLNLLNKKLICIELDKDLINYLKDHFKNTKILNEDFLKYDLDKHKEEYIIIGNIPYYITGSIFRKIIINTKNKPKYIVIMIQKEVADKILNTQKSNKINLLIKSYGEIIEKINVSKTCFYPTPKVDSTILYIKQHDKYKNIDNDFWKFINIAFSSPRKKLINNLSNIFDKNKILEIFNKKNIDKNIRAEDLSIDQLLSIYHEINNI